MKVAIDISPLKSAHRFRGVGSYTKNLVEALKKHPVADFQIELIEKGRAAKNVDLVHYPYFDLFFLTLPLQKVKKAVVTIHDVIPLVFPDKFPPGIKGKIKFQLQKFSLKGVKAVICDSKNSKDDVFSYLNYPKEKTFVIYLSPEKKFKPINSSSILQCIRAKYKLPKKFILYVGDVNYNKNIPGLIRAFKQISTSETEKPLPPLAARRETSEVKLILVGKAFLNKDLKETQEIVHLIKELGLNSQIEILGFIPDEDLVGLYNLAIVYCQPSFYEGFGLPVLEAMACGTPVVTSKKSSLPEIAGQATVMVDPYDINDIANGLTVAIEERGLREDLIQRGLEQVKKFSWQKVARETYDVYQKVVQKK